MLGPLPDTPFVSVYALTYNHEEFIADAIESVLAQDWPSDRFEFVLLDDGSTDATPERVKPYLDEITYVRQENQGINAAVSRVVGMVSGDVLMPLSGDDLWPPGKVERVVAHFQEHPAVGLLYGDMEAIDQRGKVLAESVTDGDTAPRGQIAGRLLAGNFVSGGSMAVRGALRSVMLPIPEAAAWEDWWFAWALTNVAPVDYLDAVVYRYRRHGRNFMFGLSEREAVLDRNVAEIPFRRYLLGDVRPGTCSLRDLLDAVERLRTMLATLAANGRPVESVVSVTDADRAAAERLVTEGSAIGETAPVLAGFAAARAVAADPLGDAAYRLLHAVAGTPGTPPPPFFDEVRSVTVFAEAEELVSDPSLLEAYVKAFGPGDDVTLVTIARSWEAGRLGAELGPIVERIAGDATADILALPANTAAWLTALTQADCVLGLRDLPVPGLDRFDDADALREHVTWCWRFPQRRS